jgi:GT2 family glycosyltransferase
MTTPSDTSAVCHALSIVVITYNSRRLIGTLLARLQPEVLRCDAEVIVVDNASHDDTADLVEREHPWVRLVRSAENLGFAAGNNLAVRHARGHWLLMLNPDALPEPGALSESIALMERHPEVGLGGGRLVDVGGGHQPSARMFPTLFQEFVVLSGLAARWPRSKLFGHFDRTWADPQREAVVDWVPGAFALMSTALFRRLGGFDERFFLYYEEVDLCRRIQAAGLQVHYWPQLRVEHIGGESARTVEGQAVSGAGAQLTLWRIRSGLLYYRKHHGLSSAWAVNRLEWLWHRLRVLRNGRRDPAGKAREAQGLCALLDRAWRETMGGRVSPPRPW